jgi:UDP-GlcNAc3NAcA epimerase
MKIASVVGARPNFIKMAPIHKALKGFADHTIINTGQHYDYKLSEIFFKEFNLPKPDFDLEVGSGTPGYQVGEMIKRLESIFLKRASKNNGNSQFDVVLVYGDTNSTFAGALAAMKTGIKVGHIEAGVRSFDRRMPEEINRILTDQLSDFLFAPTRTAVGNLKREAVSGKIFCTGDVSVEVVNNAVRMSLVRSQVLKDLGLKPKSYNLFTMHRAENTDFHENMVSVIKAFEKLSTDESKKEESTSIKIGVKKGSRKQLSGITDLSDAHKFDTTDYDIGKSKCSMGGNVIIFPIHPRTKKLLKEKNLYPRILKCKNVRVIEPVGYLDFIRLIATAAKIITDSGGIQKEAYLLGVPCITIRKSTEWVETVNEGWNKLPDTNTERIVEAVKSWAPYAPERPDIFGSGKTSSVIREILLSL